MKGSLDWVEVTYEADFSSPLFDLPNQNTELLKALFHLLDPCFSLRMNNFHAFGGNNMSDIRVRVTIFGGSGNIEITAEKLLIRINGVDYDKSMTNCNLCFTLVEKALKETLSEVKITTVTSRSALSLKLIDGSVTAHEYLCQVVQPSVKIDLADWENTELTPCINLEIRHEDENWGAVLHAYSNSFENSSIVASCGVRNINYSEINSNDVIMGRLERLLLKLLQALDIEIAPITTKQVTA